MESKCEVECQLCATKKRDTKMYKCVSCEAVVCGNCMCDDQCCIDCVESEDE
jgi:hypothetical protein